MGKLFAHLCLMLALLVLNQIWKKHTAVLHMEVCAEGCSTVV